MSKEFAVAVTAYEQAELIPVERPATPPGPREVTGRTLVTLISAGTELAACYQGSHFPSYPGYAAIFAVEEIGDAVTEIHPGDRAFLMGGHRSFQRASVEQILKVPDGLSSEAAAFARMFGVSMSTLTTTTARPPDRVLVNGLGLVGHLAAKLFASCGYEVIGCDPLEARRALAEAAGIRTVLSAIPTGDASLAGQIALVLECSGHEGAVVEACRIVRKRGEVVLVGVPWTKRSDTTAFELAHAIFHNYAVLRSGWEWELPLYPADFRANSIYGNLQALLTWLAEGRLIVDGLYQSFSPRDAQTVYQDLLHRRAPHLASLFDWTTIR